MKTRLLIVSLALLLTLPACAADRENVMIARADGKVVTFHAERATDSAAREQGLMFRKELAPSEGMIFLYDEPGRHAFWMKNTLIPLDMLFFDESGQLIHIHANAKPGSLEPIGADTPVCAILEIPGGQAVKQGLKIGDKLLLKGPTACLPRAGG